MKIQDGVFCVFFIYPYLFCQWLGEIFSFEQASIFGFVEFQVSWTCNTSNSNSLPTSNILSSVGWISHVSIIVRSFGTTYIRTYKGGGWFPFLCGDAFISSIVQTLVTFLTEFQAQWETSLAISQSSDTLEKIVFVWCNGKVSIRFSTAHSVWTINGWWCGSSKGWVCSLTSNYDYEEKILIELDITRYFSWKPCFWNHTQFP